MEDYMEVYDNTEPEDAWWNEQQEDMELSDQETDTTDQEENTEQTAVLNDLIETLNSSQSYGSMGDYYNQFLGCYVFPNYEVYAYFIDTDADGANWIEASDNHYVPVSYLEAYEEYISFGESQDQDEEYQPTENEIQNLELLESVIGTLSVIKENNTAFYDDMLAYEQEMLECQKETEAYTEGILYGTITCCIFLGIIAGAFISNVFFSRMRVG